MTRHFTFQTSLSVSACKQDLETKLYLIHNEQWHKFYSISATVNDNSYCAIVTDKNTIMGGANGLFGATAKGYFEHINEKTAVHGKIQNLGWRKIWWFYSSLFIVGLPGAIIASQDVLVILSLVAMTVIGFLAYFVLTQRFEGMLIDAITECLCGETQAE